MDAHLEFLQNTLDAVPDEVVVIGDDGEIRYANEAWQAFARENGCRVKRWEGFNYLDACERAAALGDSTAQQARDAIEAVLWDGRAWASMEYPCHAPGSIDWYRMVVTGFGGPARTYGVILHRYLPEGAPSVATQAMAGAAVRARASH